MCLGGPVRIVLIDNYDSFTYNLVQLFSELAADVRVYRNDQVELRDIEDKRPDGIVISPGPKTPKDSGICRQLVEQFKGKYPLLGVCLGMQIINEVFGGATLLAPRPVHGERDKIFHDGRGLFAGIPSPFWAARYHSLTAKKSSPDIIVTGWNSDGLVMALEHPTYPIYGVQFHPESFMTEYGHELAANFLLAMRRNNA